jgi:hypothetical protein
MPTTDIRRITPEELHAAQFTGRGADPSPAIPPLTKRRPALPPAEALEPWDPKAAKRVRAATKATADAQAAALAAEGCQTGGAIWQAAVAADRELTLEALQSTGELPSSASGPMLTFLTTTVPESHVQARRAAIADELAHQKLRSYLAGADDLRHALDRASDEIEEAMRQAFARTEQTKQRYDYEAARQLGKKWGELTSLYVWAVTPTLGYKKRQGDTFPRNLQWHEYKADRATGGPERVDPPLEPQDQAIFDALNRGETPAPRRR